MDKLKLNWQELTVESFDTAAAVPSLGTVHANASSFQEGCNTETDELSCPGSCEPATCDGYCGTGGGGGTNDITCQLTGPAANTCCFADC